MGEEWPVCYYHEKLKLMLVVYVDDFKLAGPTNIWRRDGLYSRSTWV